MSHKANRSRGRKRRMPWSRRRLRFLWGLSVAVAVPVALVFGHRYRADRRLEAKYEAIRAAGYPATVEDLKAWYPEPAAEENAAPVYQQAVEAIHYGEAGHRYEDIVRAMREAPKGGRLPEEVLAMMRAYLAENAEALCLLHEAAKRPGVRFPVDLSKGFAMELAHLARLREGARLLGIEALVAAHDGDPQRALDALLDTLGVADTVREEPIVVSQFVRVACHGIVAGTLARTLQVGALTPDQLALLQHAFARADEPGALSRALAVERAMGLTAYAEPGGFVDMAGGVPAWDNFFPGATRILAQAGGAVGWFESEREEYLDTMGEMIEANRLPYSEALDAMARIEDEVNESGLIPRISDELLPALTRTTQTMARNAGNLRSATTALAIERYRNAYGQLPEGLDDLVPVFLDAVPVDPFDGKPLRYRQEDDGYAVYTVAENRRDDGGERTGNRRSDLDDWAFRVLWGNE